jgi:MFS family permease
MPGRVRFAFAILVVLAVVGLLAAVENPLYYVGPALVPVVFLVLVARGHPLAWQWVRYVALLCTMAAFVLFAFFVADPKRDPALWLALAAALAFALFWSSEGPDARRYYDVYCSYCSTDRVRARDLFYNRIQCRRCGQEWSPHGPRVDADVFD